MPNNKLLLTIAGLSILINTSEDEAYARELASELDRDIDAILNANTAASVTNAAVLCAIEYLDSAKKSVKGANNMRNQVKDYMDDAAKAKFKYDEEHKRANELAVEIQSLRSHLTRLATEGDSSGVVENIKAELLNAVREVEETRDKAGKIAAANKALNEKSAAMSDCIAGHEKEIARLGARITELTAAVAQKDEQLSALAKHIEGINGDNRAMKNENMRLNSELTAMEQSFTDDRGRLKTMTAQLAALRMEAEAARSETEAAHAATAALRAEFDAHRAVNFATPDMFTSPLSDEPDNDEPANAGEPTARPVLFDYDAPDDNNYNEPTVGFAAQGEDAYYTEPSGSDGQMTLEPSTDPFADNGELEVLDEDNPVVFEGFQIINELDDAPLLPAAAPQPLYTDSEAFMPFTESTDDPFADVFAAPVAEPAANDDPAPFSFLAEPVTLPENAQPDSPPAFETFTVPDVDDGNALFGNFDEDDEADPNMPDLSWTLEV